MSDGKIAEHVGVSDHTVAKYRAELTPKLSESTARTGRDGRTIDTSNIGGKQTQPVRDERLYRKGDNLKRTFEDYCRERWDLSRPRTYQLVDASQIVEHLSTMVDIAPTSERQARPLTTIRKEVEVDGKTVINAIQDGYVNATAMCKAYDRLWADFARLDATQQYLKALSLTMGIPIDRLVWSKPGRPSRSGGTWVHRRVALHLAQCQGWYPLVFFRVRNHYTRIVNSRLCKRCEQEARGRVALMATRDTLGRQQEASLLHVDSLMMWLATIDERREAKRLRRAARKAQQAAGVQRNPRHKKVGQINPPFLSEMNPSGPRPLQRRTSHLKDQPAAPRRSGCTSVQFSG